MLPEALEKWSRALITKLLPRHMEIIDEIDKRVTIRVLSLKIYILNRGLLVPSPLQFVIMVRATIPHLENKLSSMRVVDYSNAETPVVRMANLCVVSAQTVNWDSSGTILSADNNIRFFGVLSGEWRRGAAQQHPQGRAVRGLRPPLARQVSEQDKRHHFPPVAPFCQPRTRRRNHQMAEDRGLDHRSRPSLWPARGTKRFVLISRSSLVD